MPPSVVLAGQGAHAVQAPMECPLSGSAQGLCHDAAWHAWDDGGVCALGVSSLRPQGTVAPHFNPSLPLHPSPTQAPPHPSTSSTTTTTTASNQS